MNGIGFIFSSSLRELRNIQSVCIAAVLTAMCTGLGLFSLPVSPAFHVSFGFLATALIGLLYGPVVAGMCAGISDLLSYFLFSSGGGPFFVGYTLSAVLAGVIYGVILYRRPVKFWRIFAAMLAVGVFVNIGLGTVWASCLYGYGFWGLLPIRTVKNCLTIPLNAVLFLGLAKAIEPLLKRVEKQ